MEEEVDSGAERVLTMVSNLDRWLEAVGLSMTVGSIREQTSVVVAVGFDRKLVPVHVQPGTLLSVFVDYDFQYGVYHTYSEPDHEKGKQTPDYDRLWGPFFDREESPHRNHLPKMPGVYVWRGPVTISDGLEELNYPTRVETALDMDDGPWPTEPGTWEGPIGTTLQLEPAKYPQVRVVDSMMIARVIAPLHEALKQRRPEEFGRYDWENPRYGGWPCFHFGKQERVEIQPWFSKCDPGPPFEQRELLGVVVRDDHWDDDCRDSKVIHIEVTRETIASSADRIVAGYEAGEFFRDES